MSRTTEAAARVGPPAGGRVESIRATPWAAARLPLSLEVLRFSTEWLAARLGAERAWT